MKLSTDKIVVGTILSIAILVIGFLLFMYQSLSMFYAFILLVSLLFVIYISAHRDRKVDKKGLIILLLLLIILVMGFLWWCLSIPFTEYSGVQATAGEDRTVKVNEAVVFNGSGGVGMTSILDIAVLYNDEALLIWDFDKSDGMQVDAIGLVVNHTYTKPGIYTVTLTLIIYSLGERTFVGADTDTVVITVTE